MGFTLRYINLRRLKRGMPHELHNAQDDKIGIIVLLGEHPI